MVIDITHPPAMVQPVLKEFRFSGNIFNRLKHNIFLMLLVICLEKLPVT